MNRKRREKPYNYNNSRHDPYSFPKRRRPLPSPPPPPFTDDGNPSSPTSVLVMGLPTDCSVLDLKSRFEVYGSISRTRINPDNDGVVVGSITFRSKSSAEAAISASVDPSFGITVDSKRVQVSLATSDMNRDGGEGGVNQQVRFRSSSSSSKLLRGETPLSRHGRANRLSSGVVVTFSSSSSTIDGGKSKSGGSVLDAAASLRGRTIVAYDDIFNAARYNGFVPQVPNQA